MKRTNTARWVESAGRWQINVQKDGVRKTFTSAKPGRTGQREANAKADAWLDEGLTSRKVKVAEAWAEYYARAQKTTGKSHWRVMDSRWRTWIEPRIGNRRLEGLTVQQVQDILDDAMAAGRSKKTLQNLMGDLTGFFRFCRRCGWSTFVADDLRIPEGARYCERSILQPRDFTILMSVDTTIYNGRRVPDPLIHFYRLAVLTGMRPGELLGLEWDDIQGSTIHIRRAVNFLGETTRGKNDNAVRAIPLSALAMREVEAQREQHIPGDRVFGAVNQRLVLDHWHAYSDANGLTRCSMYELRHTFVSIAQSLPEGQLRQLVGHSRAMDTYGVYAHQMDGQEQDTASRLDDLFGRLG